MIDVNPAYNADAKMLEDIAMQVRREFIRKLKRMTPEIYRRVGCHKEADELEAKLQSTQGWENGYCGFVAPMLTKALKAQGLKGRTVYGVYDGMNHAWVRCGRFLIDATYHQFTDDEHLVSVVEAAEKPEYEPMTRATWSIYACGI